MGIRKSFTTFKPTTPTKTASHGTSEFYRMRASITRRLIEEKGFTIVAAEADWPDAARIDDHTPPTDGAWAILREPFHVA